MMIFTDTTDGLFHVFNHDFSLELWKTYIHQILPNSADLFLEDAKTYDFKQMILPQLNNVNQNRQRVNHVSRTLTELVEVAKATIQKNYKKELDVEIILYLGLCNGAGWVTKIKGQTKVLLGIEKILELNWDDRDNLIGLLYHELGHVFQEQFGILNRKLYKSEDKYLWQLFTEGVAMFFEQQMMNNFEYFHQDRNGWKAYFDTHLKELIKDFSSDAKHMTQNNQRYFGDWVSYHGYPDAGYYLGARLIQFICKYENFMDILDFDLEQIKMYLKLYQNKINKEL